jgi:hypothetical protein
VNSVTNSRIFFNTGNSVLTSEDFVFSVFKNSIKLNSE